MSARKSKTISSAPAEDSTRAAPRQGVSLSIIAALLALVGLSDAVYLTVKHVLGVIPPCLGTGEGCEKVLTSPYATVAGIPLALLGAVAYFTVFSLATLAAFGNAGARRLLFYLVMLMLAVSVWLFILQAFVIHAFCQFCLLSAGTTLLLAVTVSIQRFHPRFK